MNRVDLSGSVSKGLEETRRQVGTFLQNMGHEPVLFESDSFAKMQLPTMLQTCLSEVDRSNIYVLMIGEEIGFFVDGQRKSVTHLEFRKAVSKNKTLYVFVKNYIREYYFHDFRKRYSELLNQEPWKSEERVPSFDEVYCTLGSPSTPKEVLQLVNDAYHTVPWIYGFATSDDIAGVLKSELSSLIQSYTELRNQRQFSALDDVLYAAERFAEYDGFLNSVYPNIKRVIPFEWTPLLKTTQSHLKGGTVYLDEGVGILTEMVRVGNCEGATIYAYEEAAHGKLRLVARSGLAGGKDECDVCDSTSFVSTAYRNSKALTVAEVDDFEVKPHIFSDGNQFYICQVFGRYVLTVHFPIEDLYVEFEVIEQNIEALFSGIMSLKANNDVLSFMGLVLLKGGESDG